MFPSVCLLLAGSDMNWCDSGSVPDDVEEVEGTAESAVSDVILDLTPV